MLYLADPDDYAIVEVSRQAGSTLTLFQLLLPMLAVVLTTLALLNHPPDVLYPCLKVK
jgi:hypothetical protein